MDARNNFSDVFSWCPRLYYGDEIGMSSQGDPENRQCIEWENGEFWEHDMLKLIKKLIHIRNKHKVLKTGRFEWIWDSPCGNAFSFWRVDQTRKGSVEIVINRRRESVQYSPQSDTMSIDLLTGEPIASGEIGIPAQSAMILAEI